MAWFTADYNAFFKDLARNNNKEWFDANKARFTRSVKDPFEAFVGDLIAAVAKVDKGVQITPKEAIFRLHRDVRFSKDKTPYKTRMSAIVSRAGRHDHSAAGIYLELGPENVGIYGGQYMPEREAVQLIREHIATHGKEFRKLYQAKPFQQLFGEIQGERNKVLPAEFKALVKDEPYIANKQFYYMAELPPSLVTSPKLLSTVMEHYKAMRPLNQFFAQALGKVG